MLFGSLDGAAAGLNTEGDSMCANMTLLRAWDETPHISLFASILAVTIFSAAMPASAANYNCPSGVTGVDCVVNAINSANTNGEADIIYLQSGTYPFTVMDNETDGSNGLPTITSPISILGEGIDTTRFERDLTAEPFRFFYVAEDGALSLENLSLINGNSQSVGGELLNSGGAILNTGILNTNSVAFNNNEADFVGGAVYATTTGQTVVSSSSFSKNFARAAGALHNSQGTLAVTKSTFMQNNAIYNGGAISNRGTLTVTQCRFEENTVAEDVGGGAIDNDSTGTATISKSSFDRNWSLYYGGAISNGGVMYIRNSALHANYVVGDGRGGAIENYAGSLTIENSSIVGNSIRHGEEGNGGGVYNSDDGALTLVNVTIANNAARVGGGIQNNASDGTAQLHNTIVANNHASSSPDCHGEFTSLGYNLIDDSTGCTIVGGMADQIGIDPQFGALIDDGAPGQLHLPLRALSAAIDAADNAGCSATDQIGHTRVDGNFDGVTVCDIGAVEYHPPPLLGFQCYQAENVKFKRRSVKLVDQFGRSTAEVLKPQAVCNPISNKRLPVSKSPKHLVCYKIKRKSNKQNVYVSDYFGRLWLRAGKPKHLCLPASKQEVSFSDSVERPVIKLPYKGLDHYQCYSVRAIPHTPPFLPQQVLVRDQFGAKRVQLTDERELCLPVSKDGETIVDRRKHLMCYNIKEKVERRKVTTKDQFGDLNLVVVSRKTLCVPATKRIHGLIKELDGDRVGPRPFGPPVSVSKNE